MLIHLQERLQFTSPIVIVDESVELVHDMAEYLRREYFPVPVIGHSTARQAAALIARERPSLLICSLHMPRVGGTDLITLTRKRWGNLPAVVLVGTGLGLDSAAKEDDATIYVEKSVDLATLCDRIAALSHSPPRSVPAPLSDKVLIDAQLLTAGPALAETPEEKSLLASQVPLLAAQEWPVTSLAHQFERSGVDAALTQQALFNRIDDSSWSSETPLPPHSADSFEDEEEDLNHHEFLDALEVDIELIEHPDGQRSTDNHTPSNEENLDMALTASNVKENLAKLEAIEGFIGAALADSDSGMCIGYLGGGAVNLEIAAAANTEVVRSKRKAMKALNLRDDIEDILITLGKQYHLVRPVRSRPNLFFYLVLDRQRSNLAMARFTLSDTERELPM